MFKKFLNSLMNTITSMWKTQNQQKQSLSQIGDSIKDIKNLIKNLTENLLAAKQTLNSMAPKTTRATVPSPEITTTLTSGKQ